MLTTGHGVHAFTLDRELGSFMLLAEPHHSGRHVQIRDRPVEPPFPGAADAGYIDELLAGNEGPRGKDFNIVAGEHGCDLRRILMRGGISIYPVDVKTQGQGGKLRLMYEADPMALIVEPAGVRRAPAASASCRSCRRNCASACRHFRDPGTRSKG